MGYIITILLIACTLVQTQSKAKNSLQETDYNNATSYNIDSHILRISRRQVSSLVTYSSGSYIANVSENLPSGTTVVSMTANSGPSGITYTISPLENAESGKMFDVNKSTGLVTTLQPLDREYIAQHRLLVTAASSGASSSTATATLTVVVLDINDNVPRFTQSVYAASVAENLPAGTFVASVFAIDTDAGDNARVRYAIAASQPAPDFAISEDSGWVVTTRQLDRETIPAYNLTVVARDSASPSNLQLTGTCWVIVAVLDVNDNAPSLPALYNVSLFEDAYSGSPVTVLRLVGRDPDKGPSGNITYWIVSGNAESRFRLDPLSGNLSLIAALDYETTKSYTLRIQAQDGGSPPQIGATQALISVLDVNDESPRFDKAAYEFSLSETLPVGRTVLLLRAVDHDSGAFGMVNYSLRFNGTAGTIEFPFAISSDGWLSTVAPLDREQVAFYYFSVVATDGGTPPKSSTASVSLTIIDANDNWPNFSQPAYTGVISETAPMGSIVATLRAFDPDAGENAAIVYAILLGNSSAGVSDAFKLAASDGSAVVSLNGKVSYALQQLYRMTIQACDMGQPPKCSAAPLTVTVTPENAASPMFTSPSGYRFDVLENATIGYRFGGVAATDSDSGLNGLIRYSLIVGSGGPFQIDAAYGWLTVAKLLDRESQPTYYLTAQAADSGNPSKSATVDIRVDIGDVNDNAPAFPSPGYYVWANVSESAPLGFPVARPVATDADAGQNGLVTYSMVESGPVSTGDFSVDPASGQVFVAKLLDRETRPSYLLYVVAKDAGWPQLSSSCTLSIDLIDVNDSPPRWPGGSTMRFSLSENSPAGTRVGNLWSADADVGANARLVFNILAAVGVAVNGVETPLPPGTFGLEQLNDTGAALVANRSFDFEAPAPAPRRFRLLIRASSGPLFADLTVLVDLTDANDVPPVLPDTTLYLVKHDLVAPIEPLGAIAVIDADTVNAFRFAILAGNQAGAVAIDPASGLVTPDQRLNSNVDLNFTLTIWVSDGNSSTQGQLRILCRYAPASLVDASLTLGIRSTAAAAAAAAVAVASNNSQQLAIFVATALPGLQATLASLLRLPGDWLLPLDAQPIPEETSAFSVTLAIGGQLRAVDRDALVQTVTAYADVLAASTRLPGAELVLKDASFCAAEPCGSF